jgi:hypothetical protein
MLEPKPKTEALRAGTPLTVGGVALLPIEHVVIHATKGHIGAWISVAKEPYALIVRDSNGIHMLDTDMADVSLGQLRESVPGLDTLLATM